MAMVQKYSQVCQYGSTNAFTRPAIDLFTGEPFKKNNSFIMVVTRQATAVLLRLDSTKLWTLLHHWVTIGCFDVKLDDTTLLSNFLHLLVDLKETKLIFNYLALFQLRCNESLNMNDSLNLKCQERP